MFSLEPGGLFAWLLAGLIAGWLAGVLLRGEGFGCIGNMLLGVIGAFLGQLVLVLLGFRGSVGFIGTVAVGTLGAVILVGIANIARR
jgi:uncharacterized membrane protein YeaQ/YmgE (transglycosylase-associated protein family)